MWQRFRSSPSMVVAVVSLVVALFCVLYVMERPGTIAIGSPAGDPAGGIRVIDAHGYRALHYDSAYDFPKCGAVKRWDHVKVTVPEGKQWMVIVAPAPWIPSWGSLPDPESSYGYHFEYTFTGSEGKYRVRRSSLDPGTYDELDLYTYGCWYKGGEWYYAGGIYLVVEVDEYFEISS